MWTRERRVWTRDRLDPPKAPPRWLYHVPPTTMCGIAMSVYATKATRATAAVDVATLQDGLCMALGLPWERSWYGMSWSAGRSWYEAVLHKTARYLMDRQPATATTEVRLTLLRLLEGVIDLNATQWHQGFWYLHSTEPDDARIAAVAALVSAGHFRTAFEFMKRVTLEE